MVGFIAGAYVNQTYNIPNIEFWVNKIQEEERKRRK